MVEKKALRVLQTPVREADLRPFGDIVNRWILLGGFLVHIDTDTGTIVGKDVSVFRYGKSVKYVINRSIEFAVFLDAEVRLDEVQMQIDHVSDGRKIGGTMPRGAHAREFAEDRCFLAGVSPPIQLICMRMVDRKFNCSDLIRGVLIGNVEKSWRILF